MLKAFRRLLWFCSARKVLNFWVLPRHTGHCWTAEPGNMAGICAPCPTSAESHACAWAGDVHRPVLHIYLPSSTRTGESPESVSLGLFDNAAQCMVCIFSAIEGVCQSGRNSQL